MILYVFFAIAVFYDLNIDKMNVKIAFFYGLIKQLIYIKISKRSKTKANQDIVYKLLKTLYGLKQSPRLLYKRLLDILLRKLGLSQINSRT